MFPLHVPATKGGDIIDTIRKIKDQRRQLPGSGWPYFTSRYLNEAGMNSKHTPIEILFNYLGQFKQFEQAEGLFRMEPHTNRDVGPSVQRSGLFDFNVLVIGGQTRFIINFNRRSKQQAGIRQWISTYEQVLVDTAKRLEQLSPSYTLSDFPLVAMTYPSLEKLEKDTLPALGVTRANIEDIYACSPMQEGILLSQTKDRGTYEYFAIFEATSPRGQVDVERLQAAWQQVVDRHPMLRTIFVQRMSDRPYDQIVLQKYAADGKILQIDDDKVIGVLENLDRLDYESSRPPHRLTISHTPSGKVFCKLEISHALIDGTSMAIIVSDFALAYQKELSAGEGSLYSNYISYLQAQPSRKALDYWTGHLSNVKPCQFPLLDDGIKAAKQLRIMNVSLPAASKIRQFCQAQSITLANVFRLAWALVLRSYTGSEQVCFGYLASGREVPVEGIDSAVGAFINMLVCSLDFESLKAAKGIDVLEELQEEYLTSLPHQHCSLAEIQHSLGIQGQSLFNTVLSFQRRSFDAVGSGEVEFKYLISEDPSEVCQVI
jgi:non-ribosomal peptide synthase protein (TIGR01720 family)